MEAFSHLLILVSIIIGLAITQILLGFRSLLLARGRVRLYWPSLAWSGTLLLIAAQSWWASFGLAGLRRWTFAIFAVLLLQTVLLYMMAAVVLPDIKRDERIDLRAHYDRERTPFFALLLAMLAVSLGKDVLLQGHLPAAANVGFHAAFGGLAVSALAVRRGWWHAAVAALGALLISAYVGLLFARL